jgi:uncharacterized DUF497 family protein
MIDFGLINGFDWDAGNERKSADKHGVSMSGAEQIFFNQPLLLLEDTVHSTNEKRLHALGVNDEGRYIHITFTIRFNGKKIRVISARDMHKKERRVYEQAKTNS